MVYCSTNPKRKGTKTARRYDQYKVANTLGEAVDLGATATDLWNDYERSYFNIVGVLTPFGTLDTQKRQAADMAESDTRPGVSPSGRQLLNTLMGGLDKRKRQPSSPASHDAGCALTPDEPASKLSTIPPLSLGQCLSTHPCL